jgi:hypothetical protein
MSDFGEDKNPDLNIATEIALVKKLAPMQKVNVMQWTYPGGVIVQKYASKQGKTNLLVKFQS